MTRYQHKIQWQNCTLKGDSKEYYFVGINFDLGGFYVNSKSDRQSFPKVVYWEDIELINGIDKNLWQLQKIKERGVDISKLKLVENDWFEEINL